MHSILTKTGKKPNDVPFYMRNVGLRSSSVMLELVLAVHSYHVIAYSEQSGTEFKQL